MILAAAAHARDPESNPPPRALSRAIQARNWGVLPNAGGLRDQRIGELERMSTALSTYNAFRSINQSKNKPKWVQDNPEQWAIVRRVLKMQKEASG